MILVEEPAGCWPPLPLGTSKTRCGKRPDPLTRLSVLLPIGTPQITRSDPYLATIRSAYPSPPFPAFSYPIVKGSGCRPGCRFHLDGWAHFPPLIS